MRATVKERERGREVRSGKDEVDKGKERERVWERIQWEGENWKFWKIYWRMMEGNNCFIIHVSMLIN